MSFRRPSRNSIAIIASTVLVAVAIGWILHLTKRYQINHYRNEMRSKFAIIYQGCVNYDDVHGRLPVDVISDNDDASIVSWRVYALIYGAGYGSGAAGASDEPLPDLQRSWRELTSQPIGKAGSKVFGYTDSDPNTHICMLRVDGKSANWQIYSGEFQDLPPDLILFAEIRDSDIHWLEPRDINIDFSLDKPSVVGPRRISGRDSEGFFVCFADGTVWLLSRKIPAEELAKFIVPELVEEYQRVDVLGPYRIW